MLAGAAGLFAWLVLAAWTPPADPAYTLCLFRRVTHHDCATCGMTRAFAHLAKGDVRGAAAAHPLAPPLAAEALGVWLATPWAIARAWRPSARLARGVLIANLAVVFAVWLARLAGGAI